MEGLGIAEMDQAIPIHNIRISMCDKDIVVEGDVDVYRNC